MNNMENRVRYDLVCDKIGFDWANKKMIIRVYDALLKNIAINGYYSTIRTILKDIGVIEYKGRTLVKGPNWDRFYSDEDWSWFKTSTQCGGWGEIVK